ncbi:hypothetical protein [Paenibacillus sp. GXUN7292]|uniref:hypothetical protein n=1 Tax=Paenibacillus sp. GXUN7292 TaxID=3422499 RepID=UPI003D7EE71D
MNAASKEQNLFVDDLQLVNHFIKQQRWEGSMFVFYPQLQGSKQMVDDIRKVVSMVLDNQTELLPTAFETTVNPRVILRNESQAFALINLKTYVDLKKKITECNFFYSKNKHDADYRFATLFLMETKVILDLANEIEIRNMSPESFIQVAKKTMELCLNIFGKEIQMNNMFEYFFLACSERYFGLPEISFIRRKLMLTLGSVIGGHGNYYS